MYLVKNNKTLNLGGIKMKVKANGIEYKGYFYQISKSDIEWLLEENRKNPAAHPARNLKSLAHTVYEI
jgi:hypothetical protein